MLCLWRRHCYDVYNYRIFKLTRTENNKNFIVNTFYKLESIQQRVPYSFPPQQINYKKCVNCSYFHYCENKKGSNAFVELLPLNTNVSGDNWQKLVKMTKIPVRLRYSTFYFYFPLQRTRGAYSIVVQSFQEFNGIKTRETELPIPSQKQASSYWGGLFFYNHTQQVWKN